MRPVRLAVTSVVSKLLCHIPNTTRKMDVIDTLNETKTAIEKA